MGKKNRKKDVVSKKTSSKSRGSSVKIANKQTTKSAQRAHKQLKEQKTERKQATGQGKKKKKKKAVETLTPKQKRLLALDSALDVRSGDGDDEYSDEFEEMASRKRKRSDSSDDSEAEFERAPRRGTTFQDLKIVQERLPIKTQKGDLVQTGHVTAADLAVEEGSDELEEISLEESEEVEYVPPSLEELHRKRKARLGRLTEEIGVAASSVVENPEANLRKLEVIQRAVRDKDFTICKFAVVSLASVFLDILPGYRIRLPTEAELAQKLSDEVKKLWKYETSLLSHYDRFLTSLAALVKDMAKQRQAAKARGEVPPESTNTRYDRVVVAAQQAYCDLLEKHGYFNHREKLVAAVVQRMGSSNPKVWRMCCTAVVRAFQTDAESELSLELVKAICHFVKSKSYNVPVEVLNTFLHIELSYAYNNFNARKPSKSKKRKKKRKKTAEEKELEKEHAEEQAVRSREEKAFTQTETVKTVFLTYFRVIKKAKNSPALPAVLDGLAKFAHLINIDFFPDLIDALGDLVGEPKLPLHSALQCILTASATLKGQGAALNLDLKAFYHSLYKLLPALISCEHELDILIAAESMDALFCERKELAQERVAAFVARTMNSVLHLPPQACLALLFMVDKLLRRYPRTQQLLENEHSAMGSYKPLADDPDHCDAFAACLWEFALLRKSSHPFVADMAKRVASQVAPPGGQSFSKLYHDYDTSLGGFNPGIQAPPRHPLQTRYEKSEREAKEKGKKRRNFFVLPVLESQFVQELRAGLPPALEVPHFSGRAP